LGPPFGFCGSRCQRGIYGPRRGSQQCQWGRPHWRWCQLHPASAHFPPRRTHPPPRVPPFLCQGLEPALHCSKYLPPRGRFLRGPELDQRGGKRMPGFQCHQCSPMSHSQPPPLQPQATLQSPVATSVRCFRCSWSRTGQSHLFPLQFPWETQRSWPACQLPRYWRWPWWAPCTSQRMHQAQSPRSHRRMKHSHTRTHLLHSGCPRKCTRKTNSHSNGRKLTRLQHSRQVGAWGWERQPPPQRTPQRTRQ
jgi:hypothetical protein